jgi:hypothetical protein
MQSSAVVLVMPPVQWGETLPKAPRKGRSFLAGASRVGIVIMNTFISNTDNAADLAEFI